MTVITAIAVKSGDFGYYQQLTITQNGTVKNLTGYTLRLLVWAEFYPGTILWALTGAIVGLPANGIADFLVTAGAFATVGVYYAEVELTKAGVKESSDTILLTVEESP